MVKTVWSVNNNNNNNKSKTKTKKTLFGGEGEGGAMIGQGFFSEES